MTGNLFMWPSLPYAGTQNQTSLLELITKFPLETSYFSAKNMLIGFINAQVTLQFTPLTAAIK